jgi:hypothetical protein
VHGGKIVQHKVNGTDGVKYIPTYALRKNKHHYALHWTTIRKSKKLFVYDIVGISSKLEERVKEKYPDRDFDDEELDEIANEPNPLWAILELLFCPIRGLIYHLSCKV